MNTNAFLSGSRALAAAEISMVALIDRLSPEDRSALSAAEGYWRAVGLILAKGVIVKGLIFTLRKGYTRPALLADHYVSKIERTPSLVNEEPLEVLLSHFLDGLGDADQREPTEVSDDDPRSIQYSIRELPGEESD